MLTSPVAAFGPYEHVDARQLVQGECLGSGSFAAVYKGSWRGQDVAIKRLDEGQFSPLRIEELRKEVSVLRSLQHPRLVRFVGASLSPPNVFILTELMPGGSLYNLLHRARTPLIMAQRLRMATQVSEGVAFLHGRTPVVVHRDIKSLNVLLDGRLDAKICDFGLTTLLTNAHLTLRKGSNGGSPRYMAPECYDGKRQVTEKVDVWALGCIIVEIFGGPLPYDNCTSIQHVASKMLVDRERPKIPHQLPGPVRGIVEDCYHFDVERRARSLDVLARLAQLRFDV